MTGPGSCLGRRYSPSSSSHRSSRGHLRVDAGHPPLPYREGLPASLVGSAGVLSPARGMSYSFTFWCTY